MPTSLLSDSVGAGGVPKAIAIALGLLSVAVAFARPAPVRGEQHLKALGIAALGFLYLALAPLLGYFLAIAALAGSAAIYYGAPRRLGVLFFSIGTAVVLWLLFRAMLGIAMP